MTKKNLSVLFASTALTLLVPGVAMAQEAAAPVEAAADEGIVVTARRSSEKLQSVPVSIQVVTSAELQKRAITSVEEVAKLAPGLSLTNAGSSTAVTLRGVTWQPGAGTPATPIYFNEAPFDPGQTIVSLFDVGQIEVLRGPQGTTRGAPSISGAVTISTRKPDLNEIGGYVQGLYGEGNHTNLQSAFNLPLIQGKLAVRFATNMDDSEGNRVRSVNAAIKPLVKDRSVRLTVLAQPADNVSIEAMYQRRNTLTRQFTMVEGAGTAKTGPALSIANRASVQDLPTNLPQLVDLLTVKASWEILNHKISYNYGAQYNRSSRNFNATDVLNVVPGYETYTAPYFKDLQKFTTQEVLISSVPEAGKLVDYDFGWFSKHSTGFSFQEIPVFTPFAVAPLTSGAAFPAVQPTAGAVTVPNPAGVGITNFAGNLGQLFDSFHGNVRLHISEKTELSGGVAFIRDRLPITSDTNGVGALAAVSLQGGASVYNPVYTKTLYSASLSHKFSRDLMVYATTGSSFRTGLPSLGNAGLPAAHQLPKPETAKSYELGFKSSFGRRLLINAAIFQLDYKDQLTSENGVLYFSSVPGAGVKAANVSLYGNLNARVRGAEVSIAAKPFTGFNLGANLSYSKITSQGGTYACNDGVAPTALNPIHSCVSAKGQVLNTEAPFQATVNAGYEWSLTDDLGAYLRTNVTIKGENPNFGNYTKVPGQFRATPSYALVDLYAGLTNSKAGWEAGLYFKNLFDKQAELTRVYTANTVYPIYGGSYSYDVVRTTAPREIGISLRYAYGSR